MHPEATILDDLVRRILAVVQPRRIILFGSAEAGARQVVALVGQASVGKSPRLEDLGIRPHGTPRWLVSWSPVPPPWA